MIEYERNHRGRRGRLKISHRRHRIHRNNRKLTGIGRECKRLKDEPHLPAGRQVCG